MNDLSGVSLLLVILLPALAALVASRRGTSRTAGRAGATGAALAAALSLLLLATSGSGGTAVAVGPAGLELGVEVDRLLAALLLLVTGVSWVVQAFASRYLHGDLRFGRFFLAAGLLTSSTALMVSAETAPTLAIGWSASGLAVIAMLGMYPGFRSAEEGRRQTLAVFVAGDLALWAAVLLTATGISGATILGTPAGAASESDSLTALVAMLVVVAALARSAQLPFRSWLPGTIAVPTPVSALLHAGVVNAGGILLLKASGLFTSSELATHLAFAAGALTAIYATVAMIARPDIKGSLAHSTAGQMGFMIMTCGLGAWLATVFHLIGHSLYKASRFLGSGATVDTETARARAPRASGAGRPRPSALAFSLVLPAGLLLGFSLSWYPDLGWTSGAILAFAWATLAWSAYGWATRSPGPAGLARGAALVAVAAAGYVGLVSLAHGFLGASIPATGEASVSPLWLLGFLPVAALGLAIRFGWAARPARFGQALYVQALNAARTRPAGVSAGTGARRLSGSGTLVPRSQEAR